MLDKLSKKLTNNNKEIPLFYITFDLNKYLKEGEKGSCDLKIHPSLKGDEHLINQLNGLVDYIRENYNMEEMV